MLTVKDMNEFYEKTKDIDLSTAVMLFESLTSEQKERILDQMKDMVRSGLNM